MPKSLGHDMNRLQQEQSPYLLQHKDNPVDWWPWSIAAFELAKEQNKPIFLSIGYSTCHWCHVMAHESFEDDEVATLMNEAFINIKVDREERPAVDQLYMTVCQMLTGSGGWPLTILMTPEKKPFFAATYIPKFSQYGRIGMLDLVPRISKVWSERRDEIERSSENIVSHLREATAEPSAAQALDEALLHKAYGHFRKRFDSRNGGFGSAPKFPSPHILLFLLRYWSRTGEEAALEMVETTLLNMRLGGIYDHVGGGFHRYATDAVWKVPHFEKMLYDQALLIMAYTEAYQATKKVEYRETIEDVIAYVLRDLTSEEGAFHTAEDADSEGREGKFYVWEEREIKEVLPEPLAKSVIRLYGIERKGNFEEEATRKRTGENILFLKRPIVDAARKSKVAESVFQKQIEEALSLLFQHRKNRIRPSKDDKVLTDWNGLMIAALAMAGRVLKRKEYTDAAVRAASFVYEKMAGKNGELLHRYRSGNAAHAGTLDDYAFSIWALLELYETTFDASYLRQALSLATFCEAHFWDEESGGLFLAHDDALDLLVRQKEAYDGAIPSGNSAMMLNFVRLNKLTGDPHWAQRASHIGQAFSGVIHKQPTGFAGMLLGIDFALGPSSEVVVVGNPNAEDTLAQIDQIRNAYVPRKVVLFRSMTEEEPEIVRVAPFTRFQPWIDGRATVYICRNFVCEAPTNDPESLLGLLLGK